MYAFLCSRKLLNIFIQRKKIEAVRRDKNQAFINKSLKHSQHQIKILSYGFYYFLLFVFFLFLLTIQSLNRIALPMNDMFVSLVQYKLHGVILSHFNYTSSFWLFFSLFCFYMTKIYKLFVRLCLCSFMVKLFHIFPLYLRQTRTTFHFIYI